VDGPRARAHKLPQPAAFCHARNLKPATIDKQRLFLHRHFAPLRLIAPALYGYKSVKHLVAIEPRRGFSSRLRGPSDAGPSTRARRPGGARPRPPRLGLSVDLPRAVPADALVLPLDGETEI